MTGTLHYEGLTKHKPLDLFDPQLVILTEKSNDLINTKTLNKQTGKYRKLELKPDAAQPCQCGPRYDVNTFNKQDTATLYTCMGPS